MLTDSPGLPSDFSLYGGAETVSPPHTLRRTKVADSNAPEPARVPLDSNDFLWLMTEEPHRSRRAAILKAHPEVTKLMGHEPLTKYIVGAVIAIQLTTLWVLRRSHPLSFPFLLAAYAIGGTANHNLFLAIHEITHNLAFKGIAANKWLAIFANLPIGIPYAATFKKYHIDHHKQLGEDGVDTDLPTSLELALLRNVAGKAFFCTFQILFYALRPGFVKSQRITSWHLKNVLVQLLFDYLIVTYIGYQALAYLVFSSFFAGSLHPCAGHFIAEHYLWDGLEQETYSYYGPLNLLAYNVGYHNEHHDFPSIPWTRLPRLKAIAPEFYDTLPSHPSWPLVIWNFIFDPAAGLHARVKRLSAEMRHSSAARKGDVGSAMSTHGSETEEILLSKSETGSSRSLSPATDFDDTAPRDKEE
ncbi:hypothetical protein M407DRAFT_67375 [Tulasnella calospora MUT 4182]|uniref:sphingolipid 4-desaturase n=1 Tax=Tulasnella calospora MUT 4182 TaxID=1051891 RepID=A0A0C3MDK4_9AGAM|nr:hypothetical protein M407DRAFT_67375 [Tulasnella calospora MUT 4182]